jgi:hypothetical protein
MSGMDWWFVIAPRVINEFEEFSLQLNSNLKASSVDTQFDGIFIDWKLKLPQQQWAHYYIKNSNNDFLFSHSAGIKCYCNSHQKIIGKTTLEIFFSLDSYSQVANHVELEILFNIFFIFSRTSTRFSWSFIKFTL